MRLQIVWAALIGLLASACASAPPQTGPAQLNGRVLYLERIALPRPGQVRVTLEDVSRADAPSTIVAEQTIDIIDQAGPPFPFALSYDRAAIHAANRYIVRAEIRDAGGDLRFTTTESYPVLTQDAPGDNVEIIVRMATQTSERPDGADEMGDVDFRAVGNEPGWLLDLYADRLTLSYDYGNRRAEAPLPPPSYPIEGQTRYDVRTDAHAMTITIQRYPCQDVMSGENFPARVIVQIDGQRLEGCGRTL
ncbi:MAG: YbaY family lipoprotein [Hyphomonadaceae bacterium]